VNKDKALLNKVVEARDLSPLLNRNVNDTWFADPEDKTLWRFLHTHFQKYGECPSKEVITDNFPNYPFVNLDAPIDYLLDEVLAARRRTSTVEMIGDAIDVLNKENDHESAIIKLQSGLTKLDLDGLSGSTDLDLTSNPMTRWDDYLWRKSNPGLLGIPTGFPTMDLVTNGLQPGQLIVIVAPPKTGKAAPPKSLAPKPKAAPNGAQYAAPSNRSPGFAEPAPYTAPCANIAGMVEALNAGIKRCGAAPIACNTKSVLGIAS